MINKLQAVSGLALAVTVTAIAIAPVKAESKETLISQLRGYEFYVPIEVYQDDWLQWKFTENIVVGRVVAKVGDICTVRLISPTDVEIGRSSGLEHLGCGWETSAGDDVILGFDDTGWTILDEEVYAVLYRTALPRWITRLDLKEEAEVQRTAIDWGDNREVELPPLRPQAATPVPAPVYEPEPEPIRGMW